MRVLMVAPQPFFSPRGTPFSVLNRCRALTALGHTVDLVTYPLGEDVDVPGLRIIRPPQIPGIRKVKIGPSLAKLPLDSALLLWTVRQVRRGRYDVIHTHEEAGVFGWWLSRLTRLPHLYDMHSDLAQQLTNFGFGERHPLVRFAAWLEGHVLRSASAVIVICRDLAERAEEYAPGGDPVLIENAPVERPATKEEADAWRQRHCPGEGPVLLYAGTLEPYQGVEMLVDALPLVEVRDAQPRLVIVGGRPDQVADLRGRATRLGIAGRVTFVGSRPPEEMPACFACADVLLSPRSGGTNTPLKIYSYLRSGTPIVATRRLTHTQVLDDEVAVLTEPTPEGLARGIESLLDDPGRAARLAGNARRLADERYSVRSFLDLTAGVYAELGAPRPSDEQIDAAARSLEGTGEGAAA